ncbi:MAG: TraR/DksA C4-type zinc finger protein [Nitrospirota bacterium]|jgi:DnaK suppressor protein
MAKTPAKKTASVAKKVAKKAPPKKAAAKKVAPTKDAAKKAAPKKAAETKAPSKKAVAKKATTKARKTTKKSAAKPKDRWAAIRDQLETRRAELLADAHQVLEGSLGSEKEVMAEIGDRATEEIDDNFQARLKGREHKLIAKIDDTLARMARGEYGLCESCGEEIAYARLLARPVTTMCIDCKTAQEAEERNFRR